MFNYPFYTNPSYYSPGIGSGLLGGSGSSGLLKGLASKWSWNGFLTSTGKTLNVINQAIPIFYQVRPIVKNAKTMFRVLGAVKDTPSRTENSPVKHTQTQNMKSSETPTNTSSYNQSTTPDEAMISQDGSPTFFL